MAKLTADPRNLELEDYVAAHFVSRGAFVETGVTERDPTDILELDVVWTDYREPVLLPRPVEVKSGKWHLGDLFKFYGWTQYLDMSPGQFVCREWPERLKPEPVRRRMSKLGMDIFHIDDPDDVSSHFDGLGLPEPPAPYLPELWRFSFWAQRRLLNALQVAIRENVCPESAKAAKQYHNLVNDAIFFTPDIRQRVADVLDTHFEHPKLALTAANELSGNGVDFDDPPRCQAFSDALFKGSHLPVQTCLYLAHRARISILKAGVDWSLSDSGGSLPWKLYSAFLQAVNKFKHMDSFRLFPTLWQVFLWGHGGFIMLDREEEEYEFLAAETGVPVEDVPIALSAFDEFFPMEGGWLAEPQGSSRRVVKLMPAALRALARTDARHAMTSIATVASDTQIGRRPICNQTTTPLFACLMATMRSS